jgi:hypothetical protein
LGENKKGFLNLKGHRSQKHNPPTYGKKYQNRS